MPLSGRWGSMGTHSQKSQSSSPDAAIYSATLPQPQYCTKSHRENSNYNAQLKVPGRLNKRMGMDMLPGKVCESPH